MAVFQADMPLLDTTASWSCGVRTAAPGQIQETHST
jgi:hypothetical protein